MSVRHVNLLDSATNFLMFSSTQAPSRPKPPSQLRRSTNNTNSNSTGKGPPSHSPPPPYHISPESINLDSVPAQHQGLHRRNLSVCSVSSTSNMDSSVAATAQLLGLELSSRAPDVAENEVDAERERQKDEAYVREKSREELEKLLLKAEAVIRARERELGVAAAVGKQLLETNLTLRQRHASIVSKASPVPPPLSPSVMGTSASLDAFSPPMTPIASPSIHQRTPVPFPNTGSSSKHSRRISTTPAQLAILNKQNEELLSALAGLQDDTAAADLEGKQKLRKLEKEIAGLRSELESSHQKNDELETKIDTVQAVQEKQRQRSRSNGASGKMRGLEHEESGEPSISFPNFAPLSTTPMKKVPGKSNTEEREEAPISAGSNVIVFPSTNPPDSQEPSAEYLLLSKLLSKIEELESTNRQILARHRETDSRLRNATSRSDALQKVYATLEDEMENDNGPHADADDEFEAGMVSPNAGLSPWYDFRESRGAESGGMHGLGVVFEPGEEARIESEPSLRDRGSPIPSIQREDSGFNPMISASNSARSKKSRKALATHLFESTEEESSPSFSSPNLRAHNRPYNRGLEEEPALHEVSPRLVGELSTRPAVLRPKASSNSMGSAKCKLRPKASLDARVGSTTSASLSPPRRAIRPSTSYQGLREHPPPPPPQHHVAHRSKDTLWNELKALADDDEFINLDNHEDLDRTIDSILYDHNPLPDRTFRRTERLVGDGDDEEETGDMPRRPSKERERENRAVAAIRQALDPRNVGRPLDDDEHILPVGSLGGSPGESFFLISHAVAARPTKWTTVRPSTTVYLDAAARHRQRIEPPEERRRNARADSLYGVDGGTAASARRMVALERLNEVAQGRTAPGIRGRVNRVGRRREDTANEDIDAYPREDDTGALVVRGEKKRKDGTVAPEGWGQTLLELWIILQAAIILVVFVYSMARRGPRAILDAAEVRRRPN